MTDDATTPTGCTCFRARRLTRRMTQIYDAHLAAVGLTLTQYSVLSRTERLERPSLHMLADNLGMDRTSLSRTLRPLVARGLLAMDAGNDRRCHEVALTPAGRALLSEARPVWRRAEDEIVARLGVDEVGELHRLLDDAFARLAP